MLKFITTKHEQRKDEEEWENTIPTVIPKLS